MYCGNCATFKGSHDLLDPIIQKIQWRLPWVIRLKGGGRILPISASMANALPTRAHTDVHMQTNEHRMCFILWL